MSTPNENESKNKASSIREGYEVTDASVPGVAIFLIGLFISVCACSVCVDEVCSATMRVFAEYF